MRSRLLRAAALASLAAALFPAAASPHAVLVRAVPADGSVLASAPASVRLFFDDTIRPGPGIEAIRNGGGSVLAGPARASDRVLVVPLRRGLENGAYTVRWSVISDDGHEITGVMAFAVGSGAAPVPGLSAGSSGPGAAAILARWLFFLGLLAAAGVAVFHLVIWRVGVNEGDGGRERRVGSLVLAACLAVALAGALVMLALGRATFETRFERVLTVAAAVSWVGLVAAVAAVFARFARPVALLAALVLLPAPSLAGHALDPGQSRLDLVVDVAHVTSAAVWIGGLLSLVVVVPLAVRRGERLALARRFSALALASVVLLLGSGIWRAVAELSTFSQLWSTGYGRAILVKIALLATVLLLAAGNRLVFLRGPFARLRQGVAGELVLLAGVVVAVAFLTDLPPGRVTAAARASAARSVAPPSRAPGLPAPGDLVLAREDGRLAVGLGVRLVPDGAMKLTATVVSPDNTGADGLPVTFGNARVDRCGPGCYTAVVPRSGTARVTVSGRTLRFPLPSRGRPAQGLVRRATRVFRSLRSVDYVERLSSGGRAVVSDWTLEAPDRLAYSIRGGAAGVVIGARRWDRSRPGAPWRRTAASPLRMPAPVWGTHPSNAHLVRETKREAVVSFVDRTLPGWFEVRLDRRTLLPRAVRMTAAAHFMHDRYTAFNRAAKIRAPAA